MRNLEMNNEPNRQLSQGIKGILNWFLALRARIDFDPTNAKHNKPLFIQ